MRLRLEHPDRRACEKQHQPEVRARPVASDPEAVRSARGHPDDGQADEPEREAEEADVIRDVQVAEPRALLLELEAAREIEPGYRLDPEADLGERDKERERRGRVRAQRHDEEHERAGDRQEDQNGRQPGVH